MTRTATDPARAAALELLRTVRADDAYANLVLPGILREFGLQGRDAAFATELAYGVLRWQGWYDRVLASCITRNWDEVEPTVRDILRMGAHQLLAMRVPAHAAIDTSCDLARTTGNPGSATGRTGFVNAVLRKVSAHDSAQWAHTLGCDGPGVDDLAARLSHPAWIVRALRDALGPSAEPDELERLLAADNTPARPVLVARGVSGEELRSMPGVEAGRWSPLAGTLAAGAPDALPAVADGRVGVQDEGSQLVALALADAPLDGPDTRWLDACAGPGGKAALLARLAAERGAELTAVELHPHRVRLIERALSGAPHARVITGDATQEPWGEARFDRVLVDVPCTGLGALRRRPESRWRRSPADLAALGPLQRALLTAAVHATRPGGVIAYATCSPHLAETELVVADIVRTTPGLTQIDAPALLPQVPDCAVGPNVQLWPHRHGTDAMFLALLRR